MKYSANTLQFKCAITEKFRIIDLLDESQACVVKNN